MLVGTSVGIRCAFVFPTVVVGDTFAVRKFGGSTRNPAGARHRRRFVVYKGVMAGTHSYWLILLSVIVATMASFVGLDLAARIARVRRHGTVPLWGVAGALSIAIGIWSMHFIGMLGFHLPVAVSYDIRITLLSLVMAIAGCGASLVLVSSGPLGAGKLLRGGTLIGPQQFAPPALAVILGTASLLFLLAILLISAYEKLRASRLEPHVEKLGRAVEHASEEIRDLSKRLVELQDAERRRLATELHDIVGQNLSALVTELALIRGRLSAAKEPDLHKSLADATLLAKQSVEEVRKVTPQLRPPGLDELGLPAALRWHASAFESRTGIAAKVDADESLPRPSAAVEDAVLRIYLEALTNVAKHASARAVVVKLELRNGHIRLSIADDGRGFEVQARGHGESARWGLAIMQERAAAVGGELHIRSAPGAGTLIEFSISKDKWS